MKQFLALLGEREGTTAAIISNEAFTNQALRNERLQVPRQCRPVMMISAPKIRAAQRSKFHDEYEQRELGGVDAERP